MPGFGSAFAGLACDRKLTDWELVRAVRFMVSAEYEAIRLCTQLGLAIAPPPEFCNTSGPQPGDSNP